MKRATLVAVVAWLSAAPTISAAVPGSVVLASPGFCSASVLAAEAPSYYAIELVPTRRVPGTGSAAGIAQLTFARSPFGVSLSATGDYRYMVEVQVSNVRQPRDGVFAVWVASSDLANVRSLGVLGDTFRLRGRAEWNKFLVIVSLESSSDLGDRWQGPIVMRGMSRSGMMHTMAGHGAFEAEPCVKYGYK